MDNARKVLVLSLFSVLLVSLRGDLSYKTTRSACKERVLEIAELECNWLSIGRLNFFPSGYTPRCDLNIEVNANISDVNVSYYVQYVFWNNFSDHQIIGRETIREGFFREGEEISERFRSSEPLSEETKWFLAVQIYCNYSGEDEDLQIDSKEESFEVVPPVTYSQLELSYKSQELQRELQQKGWLVDLISRYNIHILGALVVGFLVSLATIKFQEESRTKEKILENIYSPLSYILQAVRLRKKVGSRFVWKKEEIEAFHNIVMTYSYYIPEIKNIFLKWTLSQEILFFVEPSKQTYYMNEKTFRELEENTRKLLLRYRSFFRQICYEINKFGRLILKKLAPNLRRKTRSKK